MSEAVGLALFILVFGTGLAWLVYWAGPKWGGWSVRRAQLTGGTALILTLLATWYVYTTSSEMAGITLHEARVAGSMGVREGDPIVVHDIDFIVEHIDVEHTLYLHPRLDFMKQADFTAIVHVKLKDAVGKVLLDSDVRFAPREEITSRNGVTAARWVWGAQSLRFTPTQTGPHILQLELLVTDIPDIFIRIEDPMKTDGERVPGLR